MTAQIHADLQRLCVPIDTVRPHPRNPNNGDTDMIVESIMMSGVYSPVKVQKSTGYVLAGNHTYAALMQMESAVIPVVYLDVDDVSALRIMIADNGIADRHVIDKALLLEGLYELQAVDSILGTGYTQWEIDALAKEAPAPIVPDDEEGSGVTWPIMMIQVPPATKRAFIDMTKSEGGMQQRFEYLLRLAGWTG